MGLIRLRVEILKWTEGNSPRDLCPPRDESILSWLEPCQAEMSIRDLMARIATRFEEIHVGKGKLGMKWLRDGYGDILTSSLTIGECFTDRSDRTKGPVDPKDWTVQVDRAKPAYHELQNPLRFASLAPESSARAQSRLVNSTLQRSIPQHSTLQEAVAGRRPLHYVTSERENPYLRRKPKATMQDAPNDSDRPILSRERDIPDPSQRNQLQGQRENGPFVVADSQPSSEQHGASHGTPQNLSLPGPEDGILVTSNIQIDISDPSVRNPGSHVGDDLSPKSELSETEVLINQIPVSAEHASNPVNQTPVGSDGFRKPALLQNERTGLARSPNILTEITLPRYTPFKHPNHTIGRQSRLDLVESEIESSQELPPLKRPRLATPRHSSPAEPRSFNSINQEAQGMTMRDAISPGLTDDPLQGWPRQINHNSYSQINSLHQTTTRESSVPKQNKRTRQWPSSSKHDLHGRPPLLGSTNTPEASRSTSDEQECHVESELGQSHELIEQNGQYLAPDTQEDNLGAKAVNAEQEHGENTRDTFDIPSSPSPEIPTSAQPSRRSKLNLSGLGYGGIAKMEGSNLYRFKDQETPGKVRGRKLSRTSPKSSSLELHSLNGTDSESLRKRQKTSGLIQSPNIVAKKDGTQSFTLVPNGNNFKTPTRRTIVGKKNSDGSNLKAKTSVMKSTQNVERENLDLETQKKTSKDTKSKQDHVQQQLSVDPTLLVTTAEKALMKSVQASSDIRSLVTLTRPHLDNSTPAKETNLEASDVRPGILRSSASRERRSGSSVSFADAQKGQTSTVNPPSVLNDASFQPVTSTMNRTLNERPSTDSQISHRIKSGLKDGNESGAGRSLTTRKLGKGKEWMQERRESRSPGPEVEEPAVDEASERWEPYTVDGNRSPSRNPGVNAPKSSTSSNDIGISQSDAQVPSVSSAKCTVEQAPSVLSSKVKSGEESSGSSSPRSHAKEVASSASGSSVEGSVNQDDSENVSENGPENGDSDLEGVKVSKSAPEDVQTSMHRTSNNQSSTTNGPVVADHSTNFDSEPHKPKTNGSSQQAPEVITSGEDSESRAEEDHEADLQLQGENRRSIDLGSSQRRSDNVEGPYAAKELGHSASQPNNSQVSQVKVSNLRLLNTKPLASANLPRDSYGRFVGVSALNAKSKTNVPASQKPLSDSTRLFPSNGVSSAKAIQIDSAYDSEDSSSDDSEVEIKADSRLRQSRNKALEDLISVQNLFANGKKANGKKTFK